MPVCKNTKDKYYVGNEPSPKGKGYSACSEKINSKRVGTDGATWVVSKNQIGVKGWKKVARASATKKTSASKKRRTRGGGDGPFSHLQEVPVGNTDDLSKRQTLSARRLQWSPSTKEGDGGRPSVYWRTQHRPEYPSAMDYLLAQETPNAGGGKRKRPTKKR